MFEHPDIPDDVYKDMIDDLLKMEATGKMYHGKGKLR